MGRILSMKIDLSILSPDEFAIKEVFAYGEDLILIYPKYLGVKWNDENKVFRSSVWRKKDLRPASLGWRKFMNLDQQPEFEPINYGKPIEYIQKLDGSAGIISKINGQICFRTRGTIDVSEAENGYEVEYFIAKYPKLFDNSHINTQEHTILTEWTTPTNVICLKESAEPKLWLTGVVRHEDYSYLPQSELDVLAEKWGIDRPKRFMFDGHDKAIDFAQNAQEIEGLVLYCNENQVLKKAKSLYYLKLHQFRSQANIETVIDLFFEFGKPDYQSFMKKVEELYDWECVNLVRGFISKVCDGWKEAQRVLDGIAGFVHSIRHLTRKDAALVINSSYGSTGRAGMAFNLLDSKNLNKDQEKKILYQVLKK